MFCRPTVFYRPNVLILKEGNKFFFLLLFEATVTLIFKDKKS